MHGLMFFVLLISIFCDGIKLKIKNDSVVSHLFKLQLQLDKTKKSDIKKLTLSAAQAFKMSINLLLHNVLSTETQIEPKTE